MKAFIDRIFKARKDKTIKEALVEAKEFVKEKEKPNHIDCECKECLDWRKQNAQRKQKTT